MDSVRAKQFINRLCRERGIRPSVDMRALVDRLYYSSSPGKNCSYNTFEFSFVYPQDSLRLLHLNFYAPAAGKMLDKITQERMQAIFRIIGFLNGSCGSTYNIRVAEKLSEVARIFLFPVQCGYAEGKQDSSIFKLYFSVSGRRDINLSLLKKLCAILGFCWDGMEKRFFNSRLDAIGIDFYPDGSLNLKVYTCQPYPLNLRDAARLYRRHCEDDTHTEAFLGWSQAVPLRDLGFLWRMSRARRVDSLKIWCRLQEQLFFENLPEWPVRADRSLRKWLRSSGRFISSAGCKISYLALENSRIGLYFR
ncbi:MAG: hypothetical protein Q8O22_02060 [Candidatus Omnitrophota bacterium]|nr:hypothetical protein [Candidatus Omnitrophota bacterium]